MATAETYPHLTRDFRGRVCVENTRYTVEHLAAEHHFLGWTAEEILRQHPDLRPAAVYAFLAYFHDHRPEILAAIETDQRRAEALPSVQSLSRDELLRRRAADGAGV